MLIFILKCHMIDLHKHIHIQCYVHLIQLISFNIYKQNQLKYSDQSEILTFRNIELSRNKKLYWKVWAYIERLFFILIFFEFLIWLCKVLINLINFSLAGLTHNQLRCVLLGERPLSWFESHLKQLNALANPNLSVF